MADTERRFSELSVAGTLTDNDILALSQTDIGTSTLISVRATLIAIATHIAKVAAFTNDLDTTSKTLIGAINELKQLISLIPQFSIDVVQTLPVSDISETTIYLVPSSDPEQGNYYEEYIYVNNTWELVGTTAVDLSAYYTKLEVDGLLAEKANTSDVTAALALKEAKADMNDDVTDILVDLTDTQTTASGNPVTFETVQEGGAKSALVTFAPKQSGTGDPSPSNIRPISGWDGLVLTRTGKNLIDTNNYILTINSGGSPTYTTIKQIELLPGTYTFSCYQDNDISGSDRNVLRATVSGTNIYETGGTVANYHNSKGIHYVTFTITDKTTVGLQLWTSNLGTNCTYSQFMLEVGNQATIYEEYQGSTHTATFDTPIPGGSYDFVSGEGQVIYGIYVFDGSEAFSAQSGNRVFTNVIADILIPETTTEVVVSCSHFLGVSIDDSSGTGKVWKNQGNYAITFRDSTYGVDATTFKNFLTAQYNANTPIVLAYKLATPTPITLTPADVNLLKGSNTVWTDGDTVQVKYSELPNGNLGAVIDYIKKLEARVKALES